MTDTHPARRRTPRLRVIAAAIAAIGVTSLTLAPRAIVAPARGAFMHLMDAAMAPFLVWISWNDAERVLNTILFVPLGATIALLLPRRAWPLAIVVGPALSAAVEFAQASIPGRVPDAADVWSNSAGCAIGVLIVTVPRLAVAMYRRLRQRGRATRT